MVSPLLYGDASVGATHGPHHLGKRRFFLSTPCREDFGDRALWMRSVINTVG
jgi:hypothetical protein